MKASDPPVVVEQAFEHPREEVWKAITDPDEMREWYFTNLPDFRAEVGFETEFLIENEGRKFTHIWKVTEVIPEEKITYTWVFEEWPGAGYVTFALADAGDGCLLRVTNVVTEDYPQDVPEFKRESCEGGWKYFIQGNLKKYMNS